MDAETLQIKWTCHICHGKPPEHSLASLEAQDKSKKTEIFIDGDYRIYLRCPHCCLCFHATCAQYELELHLTKELRGTLCEKCATETDPSLKEKLINSLLSNSQPQSCNRQDPLDSSQTELFDSQPQLGNRQPPLESIQHQLGNDQNQLCASQSESSSQTQGNIHTWKSYEEDFLVDLRHEKNDQFIRTKNHSLLWRAISEKVNQELHCNITPTQAMNKYFSLKKKWKEVVDARTGTEAKSFRQKNQFDQLYGTKASTKPQFILDSGKSISGNQGTATVKTTADETTLSGSKQVTGRQIKGKTKRKSTEIIDLMERQNTEFHDRMEQHHQAKLSRMDRFLDLYEKDVNSKMNDN